MRRRLSGSFPTLVTSPAGQNVYDSLGYTGIQYVPQWSPGKTMTTPLPLNPGVSQRWQILNVSVQAYLCLTYPVGQSIAGKLGKILAALMIDESLEIQSSGAFSLLPVDTSLAQTLWSPDTDPLPPAYNGVIDPSVLMAVDAEISPPVPLEVDPGTSLAIGIWMFPTLATIWGPGPTAQWRFTISLARFTVNYDDGL